MLPTFHRLFISVACWNCPPCTLHSSRTSPFPTTAASSLKSSYHPSNPPFKVPPRLKPNTAPHNNIFSPFLLLQRRNNHHNFPTNRPPTHSPTGSPTPEPSPLPRAPPICRSPRPPLPASAASPSPSPRRRPRLGRHRRHHQRRRPRSHPRAGTPSGPGLLPGASSTFHLHHAPRRRHEQRFLVRRGRGRGRGRR